MIAQVSPLPVKKGISCRHLVMFVEGTHGTVPFDLSKINESEIDWQHLESIVG